MRTNIEGIYGVGDVRDKSHKQIVTTASDGVTAAMMIDDYIRTQKSIDMLELAGEKN